MTDNGSDVWSVTVDVASNSTHLYKFRNQPSYGTWDGFEDANTLVAGGCNAGEYNDRSVDTAEADIVLPVVAYGSCTAEPYVSEAPAVSFTVTAADATSVSFHSSGLGWNMDDAVVAVANGDGTWTATIDPGFAAGVEYKWVVDGVEEDLSTAHRAGECDGDNVAAYADTWFNRTWAADAGDVTGDIAGACSGTDTSGGTDPVDPPAPTTVSVTFQLNMDGVDTSAGVSVMGGAIFGQAGLAMSDDDGDNVWTVTAELDANSTVMFKYRNTTDATWDNQESVAAECAHGEWGDRQVVIAEDDITLDVVGWGLCTDVAAPVDTTVSFTVTLPTYYICTFTFRSVWLGY